MSASSSSSSSSSAAAGPRSSSSRASASSSSSSSSRSGSPSLVTTMLSFLEVAVHSILYLREVYPPHLFERRRKYGLPVFMSRHPDLNTYVVRVLQNAKPLFDRGLVRSVVVPVTGPHSLVRETYEFRFSNYAAGPAVNLHQLEQAFKACLTRLSCADHQLEKLPARACTFKIVVVSDLDDGRGFDQQAWVVTDVKSPFHTMGADAVIQPIGSLQEGTDLTMECFIRHKKKNSPAAAAT